MASEVAAPNITLNVAATDYSTVKSLTIEISGLHSQIHKQDAVVNELEGRFCQRDAVVIELEGQLCQRDVNDKNL